MERSPNSSQRVITVCSRPRRLIVSIVLCMLIIVGLFYFMSHAYNDMLTEFALPYLLSPFFIIVDLALLLLELTAVFLFAGSTAYNVRRLTSREATLVIDSEGIIIRGYFPLGNIRLSWADVAELFGRGPAYSYLYIRMKDPAAFIRSYHPVQRIFFLYPSNRRALLTIPVTWLDIPVPQILTQVRDHFRYELTRHQVSI